MDLISRLENCKNGVHEKEVIAKIDNGPTASDFVRWCKFCGAVVVESMDGKTVTEKLRTPEILNIV